MHLLLLLGLCLFTASTDGARILGLFHVPTQSHYVLGEVLFKALADRGHDVTLISSFPPKHGMPNFKEIQLHGLDEVLQASSAMWTNAHNTSLLKLIFSMRGFTEAMTELALNNTAMQDLMRSGARFDAVIIEGFMNDAHLGLATHFGAPLILFATSGSPFLNELMGNVAPYSFVPNFLYHAPARMSFTQRFINTASGVVWELLGMFMRRPIHDRLYAKYFPNGPGIKEEMKNVALGFFNSHVCFESPRPYMPNMIPVAGIHLKEPKKLPEDLQTYMDTSKEGVILFSLGSNLKSANLPAEKIKYIMNTFKKLPMKVLWKFENENLPGKPDNVKISKWLPQTDLLDDLQTQTHRLIMIYIPEGAYIGGKTSHNKSKPHPNLKIFITHGGLLSLIESMYRGVPVIVIPFYGDQKGNADNVVMNGNGIKLDFDQLTEESFTTTINEMIKNPMYRENVKKRSEIFKDRPTKPLDLAVFWVEHIIKHKGGQHLQPASIHLNLAQYLLLDVMAVVLGVLALICVVLVTLFRLLCNYCRREKKTAKKKSKKQQ